MTDGINAKRMVSTSPLLARIIVIPFVFQYMVVWGLALIWRATVVEVWRLTAIAVRS